MVTCMKCECGCGATPTIGKRFISGHNARMNGGPQGGLKHGHARHGKEHPLYETWHNMIQRCENPRHNSFPRYGGRGIQVCERWRKSFADFLADVGERPSGMTLDRWPNSDGNYEPGNVRWATLSEQQRNRRGNVLLTAKGKTQCLAAWAEETGLNYWTLQSRIERGEPPESAVGRPPRVYRKSGSRGNRIQDPTS